ncbi:MAG TPA: putative lipid II flippase FtsW, partial [Rhodanobacter sp.]|nr:putative lipid II flippase FtsW [Rhodanobacter sp.]
MLDASQATRRNDAPGRYDRLLLLALAGLVGIGIVMVTSSSIAVADNNARGAFYFLKRDLFFLAIGAAAAGIAMRTELKLLERRAFPLLGLGVLLLTAVFLPFIGMRINGAHRWLNLVVTSFQPVEAVKLILVVYVASYLMRHRDSVETSFLGLIKPLAVAAVLVLLLLAQPDFGSATLVISVTIAMVWLGGARPMHLAVMGLPLMPLLYIAATGESYRVKRLTSFMDPWAHPFTDGFQLTQSLMAIGRGEWTGVGLGSSVLKLSYLPEAHTDFIFAVLGEELGLVGTLLVIVLFLTIAYAGLRVAMEARDLFVRYTAAGIVIWLMAHVVINIGMVLALLPVIGIPLPLVSYGGSSLMLFIGAMGLLISFARTEPHAAHELRRRKRERRAVTGRGRGA